jgi:large subunit ribosomal protein L32e
MTEPSTAAVKKVLRLRERAKKKPKFVRQESWRYVRLKENWRRPTGIDNKVRKKIKGWPPPVSSGYGRPKTVRGLHPSGYEEVLVYNTEHLKEIDPKNQAIRIAHTVGKRKRVKILTEARKKKITVLNVKHVKEPVEKEKELAGEAEKEGEKLEEPEEKTNNEKPKEKPSKQKRTGKQ